MRKLIDEYIEIIVGMNLEEIIDINKFVKFYNKIFEVTLEEREEFIEDLHSADNYSKVAFIRNTSVSKDLEEFWERYIIEEFKIEMLTEFRKKFLHPSNKFNFTKLKYETDSKKLNEYNGLYLYIAQPNLIEEYKRCIIDVA